MRTRPWVQLVLHFDVHDADRCRSMVDEMVEASRNEPGTLQYDWYLDDEAKRITLVEAYESLQALGVHTAGPVFVDIVPKYAGAVVPTEAEVFGGDGMQITDLLGAETTWWGQPIAAVTQPS